MEFNEKLQQLRKQKKMTQEELAAALYVSRTAVSKWESGRGYPNIESLKGIAGFFGVSVDELLSGEEVLTIAQEENNQKETRIRDLVYGLLDLSVALFLFLPLFGQRVGETVEAVSLLALTSVQPYLRLGYFAVVVGLIVVGVLTLALQNCHWPIWVGSKRGISLLLNGVGVLLFTVSLQPYAAAFLFVFLVIKALIGIKRR